MQHMDRILTKQCKIEGFQVRCVCIEMLCTQTHAPLSLYLYIVYNHVLWGAYATTPMRRRASTGR